MVCKCRKIKPYAKEALSKVEFYPQSGSNRLTLFVENRSEWCISRQRVWGVPLPIVYERATGDAVLDLKLINYIIEKLMSLELTSGLLKKLTFLGGFLMRWMA